MRALRINPNYLSTSGCKPQEMLLFPLMYALLDSGAGEKLEQFGSQILVRPSSLCIWQKRAPELWSKAQARYIPKDGWKLSNGAKEEWDIDLDQVKLRLRLQKNGQIGLFPEHNSYIPKLVEALKRYSTPKVLNLFAYTGLATLTALKAGAQVTHIDLLKLALDWAKQNIELNKLESSSFRLIPEEALTFIKREVKRGNRYDVIIIDPPTFSRVSKSQEWDLTEVLPALINDLAALLNSGGTLFFTCHLTESGPALIENLVYDQIGSKLKQVQASQLFLPEQFSPRKIPAGYLVLVELN